MDEEKLYFNLVTERQIYGLMCGISFIVGMIVVYQINGNSCIKSMETLDKYAVCFPKNYTIMVSDGMKTYRVIDGQLVNISGGVEGNTLPDWLQPKKIG